MVRTPIAQRKLPSYSRGEEIFNSVSHIIGCVFGFIVLILCLIKSVNLNQPLMIVSTAIYGLSVIGLYLFSSLYHGFKNEYLKKIFQVFDHCAVYCLIVGTYTPILLCSILKVNLTVAIIFLILEWLMLFFIVTLNAIDLKHFRVISLIFDLLMGWLIIFSANIVIKALTEDGFVFLILGGIFYTIGAALYGLGRKIKHMHNIFHVFCLLGTLSHFLCIYLYVLI